MWLNRDSPFRIPFFKFSTSLDIFTHFVNVAAAFLCTLNFSFNFAFMSFSGKICEIKHFFLFFPFHFTLLLLIQLAALLCTSLHQLAHYRDIEHLLACLSAIP